MRDLNLEIADIRPVESDVRGDEICTGVGKKALLT